MTYNQSPICLCVPENTMVRTDQTQQECALEHGCPPGRDCPIGGCFVKTHASYRSPRTWE
jgi:hypothetical protein